MSGPEVMTYTSLLTDITSYAERADSKFVDQVPRFVMLAEQKIATEARGLGQVESVQDTMIVGVNGSALTKPAQWRESGSIWIGKGTGFNERKYLKLRSYEYCRAYAPNETLVGEPKFYADWDWRHHLIVPSPDLAYPYEWLYFRRPTPLSSSSTTNWTTQYAPQLILFATLLEAAGWMKNNEKKQAWDADYNRALKQVEFEGKRRMRDRTASVENA